MLIIMLFKLFTTIYKIISFFLKKIQVGYELMYKCRCKIFSSLLNLFFGKIIALAFILYLYIKATKL